MLNMIQASLDCLSATSWPDLHRGKLNSDALIDCLIYILCANCVSENVHTRIDSLLMGEVYHLGCRYLQPTQNASAIHLNAPTPMKMQQGGVNYRISQSISYIAHFFQSRNAMTEHHQLYKLKTHIFFALCLISGFY